MSKLSRHSAMGELAEVAGRDLAMAVLDAYAGLCIYVPEAIPPEHAISKALGPEMAARLAAYCGGSRLAVDGLRLWRERMVAWMTDEGWLVPDIARELRMHERTVQGIRARLRAKNDTAPDLFGSLG